MPAPDVEYVQPLPVKWRKGLPPCASTVSTRRTSEVERRNARQSTGRGARCDSAGDVRVEPKPDEAAVNSAQRHPRRRIVRAPQEVWWFSHGRISHHVASRKDCGALDVVSTRPPHPPAALCIVVAMHGDEVRV